MNIEKPELSNNYFRAIQAAADFMLERLVHVPFVIDLGEPTPEPVYDEHYLNGVAEIDTRSWDVV